jgi:hypothetical protein
MYSLPHYFPSILELIGSGAVEIYFDKIPSLYLNDRNFSGHHIHSSTKTNIDHPCEMFNLFLREIDLRIMF